LGAYVLKEKLKMLKKEIKRWSIERYEDYKFVEKKGGGED